MNRELLLDLRQRAEALTRKLLNRAERRYRRPMPNPEIHFDLRGRSAGMMCHIPGRPPKLRFNLQLLAENRDGFLETTVPHEVAHLVVRELFGAAARPHGREWKAVMAFFGVEANRCHDYDVSGSQTRRLERFLYQCDCRQHQLTSIRHRRVLGGQTYLCRACKQPLKPCVSSQDR